MDIGQHIRTIPDFPKPGILFYDISTLLAHAEAWRACIGQLADIVRPWAPTKLVGIESRGFLTTAPLAIELGLGFTMIRKMGKLPGDTVKHVYQLEYGTDTVEIQSDALHPGDRVVILDDLMATGGTMAASIDLVRKVGGDVAGVACIIELDGLGGRDEIDVPFESLVSFEA